MEPVALEVSDQPADVVLGHEDGWQRVRPHRSPALAADEQRRRPRTAGAVLLDAVVELQRP